MQALAAEAPAGAHVIAVTSRYHQRRTLRVFHRVFQDMAAPQTWSVSLAHVDLENRAEERQKEFWRELLAIALYWARGWLGPETL